MARVSSREWPVLAAVAAGGALGSLGRWGLASLLPHPGAGWPWATLLVNLSGSAVLGVLLVLVELRRPHRLLHPFLAVGVLGGWTTFSTLTAEVLGLVSAGALARAGAYLLVSVGVGLLAAGAGMYAARRLLGPVR